MQTFSDLRGERRPAAVELPLFEGPATVRRFDTPEFRDVTFYEVEAKSILNRVPAASRLGFEWTINVYRGCTHACAYCASGDTPVLMADGRTKPLADLRAGDAIYGTVVHGADRRCVTTKVLAHWSTVKPAYRVTLHDGTELVASGDHRFLSDRGWEHVTGAGQGGQRRPHLTVDSRLIGTGRFASLRVVSIEPLGVALPMFDITTGTGDFIANGVVSHNCFARPSHTYLSFGAGADFERKIVVKVNAPEVLRRELRRRSWNGAHVAMGTNTDPYQRCEGRYRLTRGVLGALRDAANPCSVLTKSPLLLRDLDLFVELVEAAGFTANLSIGTLDETVWRRTEPGTPHPRARMDAVKALTRAGVPCGVLIAPVLPGISDSPEQLRAVVRAAAEAGASHVSPITLHLRPGVKEEFMPWLEREYPELVAGYRRLYRGSYAPKATREAIGERVSAAQRRHPLPRPAAEPSTPRLVPTNRRPPEQPVQLSLLG